VVNVGEQDAGHADLAALTAELASLRAENGRLLRLLKLTGREAAPPGPAQAGFFDGPPGLVHAASPPEAKVAFYGAMFAARTDIYAVRWENVRTGQAPIERLASQNLQGTLPRCSQRNQRRPAWTTP
jgi:hypothetical protein